MALGGCGGVQTLAYAPPRGATPPATRAVSASQDFSKVVEAAVAGSTTTTTVVVGPGQATINGTALGPEGPVAGATVSAERLVGDQVATVEATTAADGSWTISGVLGGRYRVRAWSAPTLALTTPDIFFLGGTETRTLTLVLASFTGTQVATAVSPSGSVEVGQPANLVVQVTDPTVGTDGVVRDLPVAGTTVDLTGGPEWQVYSPNPSPTDAAGQALFQLSCQAPGVNPLDAAVGTSVLQALAMPVCVAPPPPTTTTTTTTTISPATTTATTTAPSPTT